MAESFFGSPSELEIDKIPPPPTREQEIKYIEDLENDFRTRPFALRYFPPDPTRHHRQQD